MAIDPSLTCTGWALFQVSSGRLLGVGEIRPPGPERALAARLKNFQETAAAVLEQADLRGDDVLISEAQTTMKDPQAAFLVEQIRGIVETLARQRSAVVPGRINPRSVHFEVLSLRGPQESRKIVKDIAVRAAHRLYSQQLEQIGFPSDPAELRRHQDIVDALLVGGLALTKIESAAAAGISLEELFDRPRKRRSTWSQAARHLEQSK